VEKPLCITAAELEEIAAVFSDAGPRLMVGFNRRFAPLVTKAKAAFGRGPMAMTYRINAGAIPGGTWIQDAELGGGRIVGEVCHFMDLMTFMSGSLPITVNAIAMRDPAGHDDTVTINVGFADGSIGTVAYFANGAKKLAKEHMEIYQGGQVAVISDFRELTLYSGGREARTRLSSQDKGQKAMVQAYLDNLRTGAGPVIPFAEQYAVTAATFAVLRSLRTGSTEQVGATGEQPALDGNE